MGFPCLQQRSRRATACRRWAPVASIPSNNSSISFRSPAPAPRSTTACQQKRASTSCRARAAVTQATCQHGCNRASDNSARCPRPMSPQSHRGRRTATSKRSCRRQRKRERWRAKDEFEEKEGLRSLGFSCVYVLFQRIFLLVGSLCCSSTLGCRFLHFLSPPLFSFSLLSRQNSVKYGESPIRFERCHRQTHWLVPLRGE